MFDILKLIIFKMSKSYFWHLYKNVNCRKSNKKIFLMFSLYINELNKRGKKMMKFVVAKSSLAIIKLNQKKKEMCEVFL